MTDDRASYDAILLHNLKDLEAVRGVDRLLRPHGLSIWFSDRDLRFGTDLDASINRAMHRSRFVPLCLGPHDLGNYQGWETGAALGDATALRRPVAPILLPGAAPDRVEWPMLRALVSLDLRAGLSNAEELVELAAQLKERQPAPTPEAEPPEPPGPGAGIPRDEVDSVDQVAAGVQVDPLQELRRRAARRCWAASCCARTPIRS
jgi:hypothetical protein